MPQAESAASAGCEALRAEQAADGIRGALSPGAKRPETTCRSLVAMEHSGMAIQCTGRLAAFYCAESSKTGILM